MSVLQYWYPWGEKKTTTFLWVFPCPLCVSYLQETMRLVSQERLFCNSDISAGSWQHPLSIECMLSTFITLFGWHFQLASIQHVFSAKTLPRETFRLWQAWLAFLAMHMIWWFPTLIKMNGATAWCLEMFAESWTDCYQGNMNLEWSR